MGDNAKIFYVIGRDKRQYGPATREILEGWLTNGLITLKTSSWTPGSSEWAPLVNLLDRPVIKRPSEYSPDLNELSGRLSHFLIGKGYQVGLPATGIDSKKESLALSAGMAALKFAIGHLTNQKVHAQTSVRGVNATSDELAKSISPFFKVANMFGYGNDFRYGSRAFVAIFGDGLSVLDLLLLTED